MEQKSPSHWLALREPVGLHQRAPIYVSRTRRSPWGFLNRLLAWQETGVGVHRNPKAKAKTDTETEFEKKSESWCRRMLQLGWDYVHLYFVFLQCRGRGRAGPGRWINALWVSKRWPKKEEKPLRSGFPALTQLSHKLSIDWLWNRMLLKRCTGGKWGFLKIINISRALGTVCLLKYIFKDGFSWEFIKQSFTIIY